jgi:hypothetical protein
VNDIHHLTAVSAVLLLDTDEDAHLTTYAEDGLVVLAVLDGVDAEGVADVDPTIALTPDCAEALGRDLVRRAIEARNGATTPPAGDA